MQRTLKMSIPPPLLPLPPLRPALPILRVALLGFFVASVHLVPIPAFSVDEQPTTWR